MERNVDKKISKIASKLHIRNKAKRLEVAKQINELAIILIEERQKS